MPQGTAPAAWDAADADWLNGSPLRHPPPVPGTSLKAYWYAFQRHWLLATALGLVSALVAALLVLLAPTPKYTAVSLLRIAPNEEALVFARRVERHREVIARYEIPLAVDFRLYGGSRFYPLRRPPAGSPVDAKTWGLRLAALPAE